MTEPIEFANSPVVEVAIGVQFRPIRLRGIDLGRLRERWRDAYPVVEEQPPLPPAIEAPVAQGELTFQLNLSPLPAVRYWFLNQSGTELVQLQQDRLIVNWREGDAAEPYPRYGQLRRLFEERLKDVADFVAVAGLGNIEIVQAEVNYINAVEVAERGRGDLGWLLRQWSDLPDHHLGTPEQARVGLVYRIPEIGRDAVRMYVSVDPAQRPTDGAPLLFFTLMVRGAPASGTAAAALEFMDQAHDHLNMSFAELTSNEAQAAWERLR
jgi:uncharacterized protein (TIGR04255 family)